MCVLILSLYFFYCAVQNSADPMVHLCPVPYPYAIEEGLDIYTVLHQTTGRIIGMSGTSLDIVMSGDSA
jgi:hypothetical protein